jgi:hypothetical protein
MCRQIVTNMVTIRRSGRRHVTRGLCSGARVAPSCSTDAGGVRKSMMRKKETVSDWVAESVRRGIPGGDTSSFCAWLRHKLFADERVLLETAEEILFVRGHVPCKSRRQRLCTG